MEHFDVSRLDRQQRSKFPRAYRQTFWVALIAFLLSFISACTPASAANYHLFVLNTAQNKGGHTDGSSAHSRLVNIQGQSVLSLETDSTGIPGIVIDLGSHAGTLSQLSFLANGSGALLILAVGSYPNHDKALGISFLALSPESTRYVLNSGSFGVKDNFTPQQILILHFGSGQIAALTDVSVNGDTIMKLVMDHDALCALMEVEILPYLAKEYLTAAKLENMITTADAQLQHVNLELQKLENKPQTRTTKLEIAALNQKSAALQASIQSWLTLIQQILQLVSQFQQATHQICESLQ
jgi:hypothetical protein